MTDICPMKQHTGRNGLLDMRNLVKGWKTNGQLSDQDWMLWCSKFERVISCTPVFGKDRDQIPKKEKDNES